MNEIGVCPSLFIVGRSLSCADSFTDTGISKAQVNGVVKEPKELTPWNEGEDTGKGLEELSSTHDWTPEKMFKYVYIFSYFRLHTAC